MITSPTLAVDEIPGLWWNNADAFRSRLFDAISLLLPSGEKFVITAVSDWLPTTPPLPRPPSELQREAQRFIREEIAHSRAHRLYNERLRAHAPAERLEQRVASALDTMAAWSLPTRIALASAFEQLTALLSAEVLRTPSVWLDEGETPQAKLWRWHCQEEIDHRHVVQDVMQVVGVSHARRVSAFLAAALYLCSDIAVILFVMFRCDVQARRISGWRLAAQAAAFAVRVLPSLMRMAWGSLRYLIAADSAR